MCAGKHLNPPFLVNKRRVKVLLKGEPDFHSSVSEANARVIDFVDGLKRLKAAFYLCHVYQRDSFIPV